MKTKELSLMALFVVIIAISSLISIPSVVPFTLQTFAIFFTLFMLGAKKGFYSILCYIVLGTIGLPVFAGAKSGIATLLGNTGGYIIGFLIMAAVYAPFDKNNKLRILGMIIGLIVLYVFGTAWFTLVYTSTKSAISVTKVLGWTVLPFIIPDLAKLALAYILYRRLKPIFDKINK